MAHSGIVIRLSWHVGDVILKIRRERALSLEDLADRAGLNLQTISRIEQGKTDPKGSTLIKLAEALDMLPEDLYALLPREPRAPDEWIRERDALWPLIPTRSLAKAIEHLRSYARLGLKVQGLGTLPPAIEGEIVTPGRGRKKLPPSPTEDE